jgi:hypothetical protein
MTATSDLRDAVSTVWQRQSVWSRAADRTKRRILRCRAWVLGLTVAAAVLGTASAQLTRPVPGLARALAMAAAVALALAPVIAARAGRDEVQAWTQLRSIAESLKGDVYRYLAGVAPFHDTERDRVLLRRLAMSEAEAEALAVRTTGLAPAARPLPPVRDVPSYLIHRVEAQITGYYRPAARRMARRAASIRWVASVLSGTAAALTAVTGALGGGSLVAWIGVLTTVVTALATYGASQRYEYQQLEMSRTASQLERVRARWNGADIADDAVVEESERIISISNAGWMAELTAQKGA